MADPPVRVRIAPSPTGFMHVGTARTALFNWLFARQQGGRFVLRVEDTDRGRFVPAALDDLLAGLAWLGLEPDEGPATGGAHGPYFQSERLPIYREHADRLLAQGDAYRCFCTPERLAEVRDARLAVRDKVGYDRHCRDLPADDSRGRDKAGEPCVVRLRMPLEGTLTLHDELRGDVTFQATELEDVVIQKSDGFPTYHLAVVVDDHLMGITHVLRADEWVPSAPIQLRLYAAFGWPEPVWAHVPLVLNPGGKGKLSKRKSVDKDGNPITQITMVREFREAGYLPEAMVNYLALLGWTYSGDEDVFTREQAIAAFRIADIHPSPAAWNPAKLDWMNGDYIRRLAPDDLAARLVPFLQAAGLPATVDEVRRMAPLVQERLVTLKDAVEWLAFFWADEVAPDPADLLPKKLDVAGTVRVLDAAAQTLAGVSPWARDALETALRAMAESLGLGAGPAFQPVRVAVTGQRVAPPLFETVAILGRDRTLARLAAARGLLEQSAMRRNSADHVE